VSTQPTATVERVDPRDLDLDTADAISRIGRLVTDQAAPTLTSPSGPTRLKMYQHGSDGTPFAGVWLARDGEEIVGYATAMFPRRENTDSAMPSGGVHPDHQRRGIGRALHEAVVEAAAQEGRTKLYSGSLEGGPGAVALPALGYRHIHTHAISRLGVHDAPWARWDRMHDEAADAASDYELVRQSGPTPEESLPDMVELFAAINDAPMTDPDSDPDHWDTDRVRAYEQAMQARRQTVYRVMARYRRTGAWAGHTVLCIDEFDPGVAHQEDTSVVTAHRGHRLGLLLKLDMLRWVAEDRPEVRATQTWNSTANHHMLAVNEALGTRVVARSLSMRSG